MDHEEMDAQLRNIIWAAKRARLNLRELRALRFANDLDIISRSFNAIWDDCHGTAPAPRLVCSNTLRDTAPNGRPWSELDAWRREHGD